MFGRRIFAVLLLVLFVIGLLSLGGYLGWSQGYMAGLAAADGGEGVVGPRAFYGYGFFPFFPFFFGFGLFFKFAFLLLLFFLIFRMFGFWRWRMAGGPPGWGKYHHRHHHGPPPWYRGEEEAESDADGEEAEAKG